MAKTKAELHKEGVASGALPADSDPDDYTLEGLQDALEATTRFTSVRLLPSRSSLLMAMSY